MRPAPGRLSWPDATATTRGVLLHIRVIQADTTHQLATMRAGGGWRGARSSPWPKEPAPFGVPFARAVTVALPIAAAFWLLLTLILVAVL